MADGHAHGHGEGHGHGQAEAGRGHGHAHESGHAHASGHAHGAGGGGHTHAAAPAPGYATVSTIDELVERARRALSAETWDHVVGGAESETTIRRNRAALDAIALRGRILGPVDDVSASATLLGATMRMPVVLAPIGTLGRVTPAGPRASIAAASGFGTVAFVSAGGIDAQRDLADAGPRTVYQVYARGDREWLLDQAALARSLGCLGICLTSDVPWFGRRERDLRRAAPAPGPLRRAAAGHPATWEDVDALVDRGGLPVVVKGVMTAEDARAAIDRGVAAVYVSNHGGRQLDHAEATITALAEVVDAVAGRAEVVVDGGFLHGTDVVKALATGADAVAIGKLQALALAAGGEAALVNALEVLEDEVRTAMALMGASTREGLNRGCLRPAIPVAGVPHPLERSPA